MSFTDKAGKKRIEKLGYVSPESATQHNLDGRIKSLHKPLVIASPHARIRPPYAQENDADELMVIASRYAETSVEQIPEEERAAYLSALWRESNTMDFGLKHFPDLLAERLESVPEIKIAGIQYQPEAVRAIPEGECTVKFAEYTYQTKAGAKKTSPSISIITPDGEEMHLGAIDAQSVHLPIDTTVTASITVVPSGKAAVMQVLDVVALEVSEAAIDEAVQEPVSDQESNGYAPTRQELLQWARAAIDNGAEEKVEEIINIGERLKLAYSKDTGDTENKPPLDYSHRSVVLSPNQHKEMSQAILEGSQSVGPSEYRPTWGKLSQWMATAEKLRDAKQAFEIVQIKSRLEATYKGEAGSLFEDPPEDYSHPDVTLSKEQYQKMSHDIESSVTAAVVESTSERVEKLQLS